MEILKKAYFLLLDGAQTIIVAVALFVIVYTFLFRPFQVIGESSYPNYKTGERIITNIVAAKLGDPKLGDMIVIKAPPQPDEDFIKRVIGTPGDRIMIQDGKVYLNGKLLDESAYIKPDVKTYGGSFLREGEKITVPAGNFFVMGDNRSYSSDSREWGFVPKENVIGTAMVVFWPSNETKLIENPY